MSVRIGVSSNGSLDAALRRVADKLQSASVVKAGFLENATYPDGTPVASVAAANEFGATIKVPEHEVTVYRQTNKARTGFNKKGRFVKKAQANFETTHTVPAHTITIPARPFFRQTIAAGKEHWGADLGKVLVATGYDARRSLNLMGQEIKGELQDAIRAFDSPANAPSTIAKKGFDKPLIASGHMLNSVDSEVE